MNNNKTKLLLTAIILPGSIFLLLLSAHSSYAQERWQADVSVTSVVISSAQSLKKTARGTDNINRPVEKVVQAVDDNLKCTITIHNENDDDAWGTMMVVVLPVEVSVLVMPANATLDKSVTATQPLAGHIIFNIGHMTVGQNVTVEFTFTKSKFGNKVGAYAYSDSPDPNPVNNYKDAVY
jgi:Domain of unknown function DUF11